LHAFGDEASAAQTFAGATFDRKGSAESSLDRLPHAFGDEASAPQTFAGATFDRNALAKPRSIDSRTAAIAVVKQHFARSSRARSMIDS
jgi:hypothetical protein